MEKTEKQKMLAGEPYRSTDPQLVAERQNARRLTRLYNATTEQQSEKRVQLLRELFGTVNSTIEIEPPFHCDYGYNIHAGENFYMNFNCVILDCCPVHIGNNVLCAPAVQIYTATHPTAHKIRLSGLEFAAPVRIGHNVWIGGGAIICPGVTIGDNTTIAAGSVVVKDIPAHVVAGGNPCRIIRQL